MATLQPVLQALGYRSEAQQRDFIKLLEASGAFGELPGVTGTLSDKQAQAILTTVTFDNAEAAAHWLHNATQEYMLHRQAGMERHDCDEPEHFLQNRGELLNALHRLGALAEVKPQAKHYDHVLVLGAVEGVTSTRLDMLKELWDQGVRFDKIHLLGSERPLDPEHEPLAKIATDVGSVATEMQMMIARAYEKSESWPEPMKNVRMFNVESRNRPDGSRANTRDTIVSWLKTKPQPGNVLVISSQPNVAYQDAAVKSVLLAAPKPSGEGGPPEYTVETVGARTSEDGLKISVAMDAIARRIDVGFPKLLEALKTQEAAPDHTLTQEQIESIVTHISHAEHQQLSLVAEPKTLQGGLRRTTYKFETDNNKAYVVSVSNELLPASKQEHELNKFLYNRGAPIARPIGDIGELPLEGNDKSASFVVNEFVKGKGSNGFPHEPKDFYAFGIALAKLHSVSEAYFKANNIEPDHHSASQRETNALLRDADAAEKQEAKRLQEEGVPVRQDIMDSAQKLRNLAVDLSKKEFKEGLAHGDAIPGNVIIGEDGNATLIDMETCGKGVPAKDLAFAILWGGIDLKRKNNETYVKINEDKIDALLAGYQTIRPLDKNELECVYALVNSQARSYATLSNRKLANSYLTPTDYLTLSDKVERWTDEVIQNRKGQFDHRKLLPHLKLEGDIKLSYSMRGLSDPALDMVAKGEVPVQTAAQVAERVNDPERQEAAMRHISAHLRQNYSNYPARNHYEQHIEAQGRSLESHTQSHGQPQPDIIIPQNAMPGFLAKLERQRAASAEAGMRLQ